MTPNQIAIAPVAHGKLKAFTVIVAALFCVQPAAAQEIISASAAMNAAVARARARLDAGDGPAARTLMDSLVDATASGSMDKGEALFWRAALSEQAADAEKDWRLLLVDVPLSPRVADAALRLAELERARGRFAQSRFYVMRLLRDHPASPLRSRALLQMARSYFDESDSPHACGVLTMLRAELPANATEVKLQSDELMNTCRGVQAVAFSPDADLPKANAPATTPGGATTQGSNGATPPNTTSAVVPPLAAIVPPPATTTVVPPSTSATTRDTSATSGSAAITRAANQTVAPTNPPAASPKSSAVPPSRTVPSSLPPASSSSTSREGRWSVQLAAYDLRTQADGLVKRLSASGIDARVDGDVKPFRVRVGHYATQVEATSALAKLKTRGQGGFVTELAPR